MGKIGWGPNQKIERQRAQSSEAESGRSLDEIAITQKKGAFSIPLPSLGLRFSERRLLAYRPSDAISDNLFEGIMDCGEMGIPLVTAAAVYEELIGRVPLMHVGRNLSMVFPLTQHQVSIHD